MKDFNGFQGQDGLHTAVDNLLSNYPNGVPDDLDVVLYVHSAPGLLLLGEWADGKKITAEPGSTELEDLISFLRPLLAGKDSRLIIIGCDVTGRIDGSGKAKGKKLMDRLRSGLRRPIIGNSGQSGLGKNSPGLYIDSGGGFTTF